VNGVQCGSKCVCSVNVGPRCPPGRKTCRQQTLGYSSSHGGYGGVVWVKSEMGEEGMGDQETEGSMGGCVWVFYAASTAQKAMVAASTLLPGGGWRHALVNSGGGAATLSGGSCIGCIKNKPTIHAHPAAVLAAIVLVGELTTLKLVFRH
jgi:hypothetical protein